MISNLLLVGNDNYSDIVLKNRLEELGYLVEYVSTEHDLIILLHKSNNKIDLIIFSGVLNTGNEAISENILNNINLPFLFLQQNTDTSPINIDRKIEKILNELTQKEKNSSTDDLIDAFALHDIICDKYGKPINYRFLDADKKFLKRIGKKKEEIIGKTALELFPKTEKIWIETFGRVALTGKPEVLLDYSVEFDSYYEARIYSPEKGKFLALFIDTKKIKGKYS